ncbi:MULTISPECIES: hypothetical protein [unclassified Streptomyces]|uniref:hypothetical protein n=1 Tax=unclassified Streptomyces TaxID=2593676 RepID=UPI0011AFA2F4|nr:hypothetical protein [Streptomyces sp. CB02959]
MSHTELERLARIRIQVTGESLERALAVLRGDTTDPRTGLDLDAEAEASSTSAADPDREAEPPHQPPPPRRRHLRSL